MSPTIFEINELIVRQRKEIAELFGYETRNKYEILHGTTPVAFAAEQGKGIGAWLVRQWIGHWRTFEIHIFDATRQVLLKARHPFRFFFQRLEVSDGAGKTLGAIQQRFSLFYKRFDVNSQSRQLLEVRSPFWRPWTFEFKSAGKTVATVRKRWSGLLKEAFTDADNFQILFVDTTLSQELRALVITSALFIDLQYFEQKAD